MEVDGEEKTQQIQRFSELTGIPDARSRHFLEASAWNVEVAASTYFESLEDDDIEILDDEQGDQVQILEEQGEQTMSGKKFATLNDSNKSGSDSGGEDDEKDRGQAFFAGGGQQVLGPKRDKKRPLNPNELVTDVFSKAKEHGAEVVDPSEMASGSDASGRRSPAVFQGGAYRLGDSVTPAQPVGGPPVATRGGERRRMVGVVLRMWENGFSLDDGPLRPYDHPDSRDFIESIKEGGIPAELRQRFPGKEIDLQMENHHGEPFKPAPTKPFTGKGNMLGSYGPSVVDDTPPVAAAAEKNGEVKREQEEAKMEIDESQPVTTLQIRLGNGTRIVQRFNLSHTVNDVRSFICRADPESAMREFVLMTSFPTRELEDENLTLEQAGLKNAVVVQKIKA